jgi:hypothetical protein
MIVGIFKIFQVNTGSLILDFLIHEVVNLSDMFFLNVSYQCVDRRIKKKDETCSQDDPEKLLKTSFSRWILKRVGNFINKELYQVNKTQGQYSENYGGENVQKCPFGALRINKTKSLYDICYGMFPEFGHFFYP